MPKTNKINKIKFILLFLCFSVSLFFAVPKAQATPVEEAKLIELANQERLMRNLQPLTIDPLLYFAASNKAKEMIEKDYFDHYSPTGKSPWDFIKNTGYYYLAAGENLAMDFRTSEGTHRAWMNSPPHRDNILDPDFEDIAIAVVKGDFNGQETAMAVEMFGKKDTSWTAPVNSLITKITNFLLGF